MIELYQLCMSLFMNALLWYFDVNDLIENVLGGGIGFVVFLVATLYLFRIISKSEIYKEHY